MRFHRPDSGLGLNDKAVACLKAARKLESLVSMWDVEAANHLLSERDPNEAFLAALPGKYYALYFPAGGEVGLDLFGFEHDMCLRWINIDTGEWGDEEKITGGKTIIIHSPGTENYAAVITAEENP